MEIKRSLFLAGIPNELIFRLKTHINELNRTRAANERPASMSSVVQGLIEEYLDRDELTKNLEAGNVPVDIFGKAEE